MLRKLVLGSAAGACGLFVGVAIGCEVCGYVHRAADGSSLPACANDYLTTFGLIGLIAGAYVGVLLSRMAGPGDSPSIPADAID